MVAIAGNITESFAVTDWRVSAHKCKDGSLSGTTTTSGTTYSITCADTDICNVSIAPVINYAWAASKQVHVGEYVVATNPDTTPHIWKATTAAEGDILYNETLLSLHCNGADGGTTFTDSSSYARTVTPTDFTTSTTQFKYGSASAKGTLATSVLTLSTPSDFTMGTSDFNIRAWIYLTNTANTYNFIAAMGKATGGTIGIRFGDSGYGYKLQAYVNGATTASVYSCAITKTTALNAWHLVELEVVSGVAKLYYDYVQQNLNTGANPTTYPLSSFSVGTQDTCTSATIGNGFVGYIDEVSITKAARHPVETGIPTGELLNNLPGLTGAVQPTWNLSSTTTDNTVTWTYVAALDDGMFKSLGAKVPS